MHKNRTVWLFIVLVFALVLSGSFLSFSQKQTQAENQSDVAKVWTVTYDTAFYKVECGDETFTDADFAALMLNAPFAPEDRVNFVYDAQNGMPIIPSDYQPVVLKPAVYSGKLNIGTMGDALIIPKENTAPVVFSDFTLSYYMENNIYGVGNFRALNALGEVTIIDSVFNAMTSGGNLDETSLSGLHFSSRAQISGSTISYAGAFGVTLTQEADVEITNTQIRTGISNSGKLSVNGGTLTENDCVFVQQRGSADLSEVEIEGSFLVTQGEVLLKSCIFDMKAAVSQNSGTLRLNDCRVATDGTFSLLNQNVLTVEKGNYQTGSSLFLHNEANASAEISQTVVAGNGQLIQNVGTLKMSNASLSSDIGIAVLNRGDCVAEECTITAEIAVQNEYRFRMTGGLLKAEQSALTNTASGNATLRNGEMQNASSSEAVIKNLGVINIDPGASKTFKVLGNRGVYNVGQLNALNTEIHYQIWGVENEEGGRCNFDNSKIVATLQSLETIAFINNGNLISQNAVFQGHVCIRSQKGVLSLYKVNLTAEDVAIDINGGSLTLSEQFEIRSLGVGVRLGENTQKALLQNGAFYINGTIAIEILGGNPQISGCIVKGEEQSSDRFIAIQADGGVDTVVEDCEIETNSNRCAIHVRSGKMVIKGGSVRNMGEGLALLLDSGNVQLENTHFTAVNTVIQTASVLDLRATQIECDAISAYAVEGKSQAVINVYSGEYRGNNLFNCDSNATLTVFDGHFYAEKTAIFNSGKFTMGGGIIEAAQCLNNSGIFELQQGELRGVSQSEGAVLFSRSSQQTLRGGKIFALGVAIVNQSASTVFSGDLEISADICVKNELNLSVANGTFSAKTVAFLSDAHSLTEFMGGTIQQAEIGIQTRDFAIVRIQNISVTAQIGIENTTKSTITFSSGTITAEKRGIFNKDAYFEMKGGTIEAKDDDLGVCFYQEYAINSALYAFSGGIFKGKNLFDFDQIGGEQSIPFVVEFCGVSISSSQAESVKVISENGDEVHLSNPVGAVFAYTAKERFGIKEILSDGESVVYEKAEIAWSENLKGKTLTVSVLPRLTIELISQSFIYSGAPYSLQYKSEAACELLYYEDIECTRQISAQEIINAGTYYVKAVYQGKEYMDAVSQTARLEIAQATVFVTAQSFQIDEGESFSPVFLYEGFVNGEDESVLAVMPQCDIHTEYGIYSATPYGAQAKNYAFDYLPFTYSVNRTSFANEGEWGIEGSFHPDIAVTTVRYLADDAQTKEQQKQFLQNFQGKKEDVVISGYYNFEMKLAGEPVLEKAKIIIPIDESILNDSLLYSLYLVKKNADGTYEAVSFTKENNILIYSGEVNGEYLVVALIKNLTWLWVSIPFMAIGFFILLCFLFIAFVEIKILASQRISVRLVPLPIRRRFGESLKIEEEGVEEKTFSLEESMSVLDRYYQNIVPIAQRKKTEKEFGKATQKTDTLVREKSLKTIDFKTMQKFANEKDTLNGKKASVCAMSQEQMIQYAESLGGAYRVYVEKKGKKVSFKVHGETFLLLFTKGEQTILGAYGNDALQQWKEKGQIMHLADKEWFIFMPDESFTKDDICSIIHKSFITKSEEIDD